MQEASRRSEHWGIISSRRSLAYFARFAQSQFISPDRERGSLISIDRSIQWYIGYVLIFLGRLMATAYMEFTVHGPGPCLCHSVVTCTVARVEENVYKPCGLTESLVYSLEILQRMHSRAVPCHAMAIALARRMYTLIHEPSEVTSRQPPPWPRGSNITYIYTYIYIQQTRADVMQD